MSGETWSRLTINTRHIINKHIFMKIYDLHQDLMTHIRFRDELGQSHQTSFEDIHSSTIDLVIATAFPFPKNDDQLDSSVPSLITEELQMYCEYLTENPGWQLIEKVTDLNSKKQKIILHLEGLNVFDGSDESWQQLDDWVELGVRSIGTHWNVENQLGGGTLQPEQPLTKLGHEVIEYLEDKNIIFDLAHMGRQSFADAIKLTNRPLYISHGNADAVYPNVRNYTNKQLRAVAESDGVIGVFFANTFVVGKNNQSKIEDVVAHIEHIKNLIGVRHVAIGSDFGGVVTGGVQDLSSVGEIENLLVALKTCEYSEEDIEAIAWKNADRILRSHLI